MALTHYTNSHQAKFFLVRIFLILVIFSSPSYSQTSGKFITLINKYAKEIESKVIEWRRDFHQNPELGNREFRTAEKIANHLRNLGIDVQTNIAHTGVVGILKGKKDKPVVALRSDIDALPVTEATGLPFASKANGMFNGKEVGVMHACGHDAHMAILMGVAEILSEMRDELEGTVKFIFQPAEEGAPEGEEGGASLMIKEGVLENPKPDAIFGLHVRPVKFSTLQYSPGPALAGADILQINVKGKQTHAAAPWGGIDPIVVSAQIIQGLQTIVSRQLNISEAATIISISMIHGGMRWNIIPDEVKMRGTIRTFDKQNISLIHEKVRNTAINIAESAGATVEVTITPLAPVTFNNYDLTRFSVPVMQEAAGADNVVQVSPWTPSEDFAYYADIIPGFYFFLGIAPPDADLSKIPMNHSPFFDVDERALIVGMKALSALAVNFLKSNKK